jgi:hypothetical protein
MNSASAIGIGHRLSAIGYRLSAIRGTKTPTEFQHSAYRLDGRSLMRGKKRSAAHLRWVRFENADLLRRSCGNENAQNETSLTHDSATKLPLSYRLSGYRLSAIGYTLSYSARLLKRSEAWPFGWQPRLPSHGYSDAPGCPGHFYSSYQSYFPSPLYTFLPPEWDEWDD